MRGSGDVFEGSGGGKERIFWQCWLPSNARAAVVLVHGLGEHSGRYEHVAALLLGLGCAVYALDHRGHGRSTGARGRIDRFDHAVDDIDQLVQIVQRERRRGGGGVRPVFLLGHSLGGALALRYALKYSEKINGLILSGPAVVLAGTPPLMAPLAKFLSFVAPGLGVFKVDPTLVSRDPAVVAQYTADPYVVHGKVPARTLGELVTCTEWLPAALQGISVPLLVMHGGDDRLCAVEGARLVAERANSQDTTLKIYDGLYHEIFNELPPDRERVLADLGSWLGARLPAAE